MLMPPERMPTIAHLFRLAPVVGLLGAALTSAAVEAGPGLMLTFAAARPGAAESDSIIAPNVWLHVAHGETPSPFLAPGPFTAIWKGSLSIDVRNTYTFQAEVNGSLSVVINAQEVLRVAGDGSMSDAGPPIRLNKGPNEILVTYTPAEAGDAHVRLFWTVRGGYPQLLPSASLSPVLDEATLVALRRQRGRELVIEHRCLRCHALAGEPVLEARMNAPEFAGIGSRRSAAWLREWLLNPRASRRGARMPTMFHAGDSVDSAEAVAAFLASLGDPDWAVPPESTNAVEVAAGSRLFEALQCSACHPSPGGAASGIEQIPLNYVAAKFTPGALARFLREPTEHYGSIRMPDFRLSETEANRIAAFLRASTRATGGEPPRPELAPQGRDLVQTTGCLNCHSLELENLFKTRGLAELTLWDGGCLASGPLAGTRIPHFGFGEADRGAIREFAEGGFESLTRHVDSEFAARQLRNLNCAGCHQGHIEGIPSLELLGGKIKPEYGVKLLAGSITGKPRPWIAARMPGFATRADGIARGLANRHGFPAVTPPEPEPVDEELAAIGFQLVQSNGGFSCIICHAVGKAVPAQPSESMGVNFALTFDRLQRDYFNRWLRDPLAVDPSTKMPAFFDSTGRSSLKNLLGGNADRQIEAIWQYFRQGADMRVPRGMGLAPSRTNAP